MLFPNRNQSGRYGVKTVTFRVQIAAIPEASYEWLKNGKSFRGTTNALVLQNVSTADSSACWVTIKSGSGTVTSSKAVLNISAP